MKKTIVLMLIAMILFSFIACQPAPAENQPSTGDTPAQNASSEEPSSAETSDDIIKIGCFQPLTGANATQGIGAQNAVALYIKELNERGGLLGKKVEAVYYDDASDTEEAVKIVTKLIEVDKIDLCVGSIISSCLLASGQALNDAKIPTYGIGLSPTWMAQGWDYFFRPTINTSKSIPSLTGIMDKMGFESVAVFEGQDDYGVAAGQSMRTACEAAGKTVTTTENYVSGDTDFSGQIAKILATEPDCVFLGVFTGEVGNVIKQFRQFGYEGIIFYSETIMQDVLDIAGDATNHVVFSYPYVAYQDEADCTDDYMLEFIKKYKEEYGTLPLGDAAYRGWDAMLTLEAAVIKAGTIEGEAVKNATLELSDLKSLAGTFDFSAEKNGEGLYDFASWIVVDGKSMNLNDWYESEDYKTFSTQMGW